MPTSSAPRPVPFPGVDAASSSALTSEVAAGSSSSQSPQSSPPAADEVRARLETALFEMKRVIVGQETLLERVLVALLVGGHLLIEGVPGLAKTLTVRTLAGVVGGTHNRIQFTPDLVPSDLVGTRIYRPGSGPAAGGSFDTELGPVFCNFLLADEVNRAPAKVQSALLEVMQEGQVTIGHTSHAVPRPFLVLATQNPIESEGTYALPEAQLDRFMMKVVVDYPGTGDELEVVRRSLTPPPDVAGVLSVDDLLDFQQAAQSVYVDREVAEYAVTLTAATRRPADFGLAPVAPYVDYGASPRGSLNLVHGARAVALLRGRNYALPQDVAELAKDVLRHRVVLSYQALAESVTADQVIDAVMGAVPVPHIDLADERRAS
jgi:MoxR-like ATPase